MPPYIDASQVAARAARRLSLPATAHALGPVDLEIGAKAGGGTNPGGTGGANPLSFGVGARAGASLFGWYAGLTFVDYLGRTQTDCGPGFGGPCETIAGHSLAYGVELGYGYRLGRVTLRPQVGVGDLEIHQTVSPGGRNIAPGTDDLYFEPGLVVLVALGFVYVGADANLMLLPFGPSNAFDSATGKPATAVDPVFTAHGQVGVRF